MDRACQRVLQVIEHQHGEGGDLVVRLTECRQMVWRCCAEAVRRSPGSVRDVPRDDDLAAVHRALSRAATSVAQAAQALVMAEHDRSAADRAVQAATARAREAAEVLDLDGS